MVLTLSGPELLSEVSAQISAELENLALSLGY